MSSVADERQFVPEARVECPVCRNPFSRLDSKGRPRDTCSRSCAKTLYHRRRQCSSPSRDQLRVEAKRAREIISTMSSDQRSEYEVEGCLPILESSFPVQFAGVLDEDLDPTPVPTGCHCCWRTGSGMGTICDNCPDPQVKAKRRAELSGALASPV